MVKPKRRHNLSIRLRPENIRKLRSLAKAAKDPKTGRQPSLNQTINLLIANATSAKPLAKAG